MKKRKIWILIGMLPFVFFFLNGCSDEWVPTDRTLLQVSTGNPYASSLLTQLKVQDEAYADFLSVIRNNRPAYDLVGLHQVSEGFFYAVPFLGDDEKIEGYVKFPVDILPGSDACHIEGNLGFPVRMDAIGINDVPIVQRFLYSSVFCDWEKMGVPVDSGLSTFAKFLDGKVIPVASEDVPVSHIVKRGTSYSYVEVSISYIAKYKGGKYDAIYALSLETLQRIVEDASRMTGFSPNILRITAERIFLELTLGTSFKEDKFKNTMSIFVKNLIMCADWEGYDLRIQYSYKLFGGIPDGGGPGSGGFGGGGPGGNSSGSGNSSGTGAGSPDSSERYEDPPVFTEITDSCDELSEKCKACMSDLFKILNERVEAKKIGEVQMASYQMFLDAVAKEPQIEHATSLVHYGEEGEYLLAPIQHGTETGVDNLDTSRENTIAFIHNHPQDAPPSAKDLLMLLEQGMKKDSVRASIICVDATKFYALYITDRTKIKQLYDVIKDEVDEKTNNFRTEGTFSDMRKHIKLTLKEISWNEYYMYVMATIIDLYSSGAVKIVEIKEDEHTVYNVKKERKNKRIIMKPIKCQ